MRSYAIVEVNSLKEFVAIGAAGREQYFWGDRVIMNSFTPNMYSDPRSRSNVYFCDRKEDAEAFASQMLSYHPGTTWVVLQTLLVYRSKVTRSVTSVSKMENGALVPVSE